MITALKEGILDANFSMGASVFRPLLNLRGALGKITGVTSEKGRQIAALLESQGIKPGALQAGNKIAKGFARTVGIFSLQNLSYLGLG